jgi:outer membrane protein TolC
MRYLISLFSLFLVGCLQNNDYHKPNVLMTNQWSVTDKNLGTHDEKNIPYLAWWEGYHDPALNELIKIGLQYNNNLNMSRGSIEAAEGELKKINYQWIPTVDLIDMGPHVWNKIKEK